MQQAAALDRAAGVLQGAVHETTQLLHVRSRAWALLNAWAALDAQLTLQLTGPLSIPNGVHIGLTHELASQSCLPPPTGCLPAVHRPQHDRDPQGVRLESARPGVLAVPRSAVCF